MNAAMSVADSAEGLAAPSAGRAMAFGSLAFASSFTACLLAAAALAITVFGRPAVPGITLELTHNQAPHEASKTAAPAAVPVSQSGAIVGPVTGVVYAGRALIADPALIENTAVGPLPRIADDGRKPMTVYAAPASASAKFKIAIVVSGLGTSASATKAALAALPPAVTLGFAPYAGDVGEWAGQARAQGHEVLLQIPMEPFDFPDSDPGPNTLRAGQDEEANLQRMRWALSRFTGYAGVTNLLGQRFLADSAALSPALTHLNRRGLYFFDNGAASQSAAPGVAAQVGIPAVQSNANIDSIQTATEIDRRLLELESLARTNGSAVGSASLYPVSVARIAAWAKGLQARGFVLVPVSAILPQPSKQ